MYNLKVIPSAQKDLDSLERHVLDRIKPKMIALKTDPRPEGSVKLTGEEGYRIRIGDYRVLYRVDDASRIIYFYRIKHRKEVYRA